MGSRELFVLTALALVGGSCTGWRDETKGLGPTTQSSATGGSGGGGACLSCNDFFVGSSTCQPPDCPTVEQVCAGAARDALDALLDCAFCDTCPTECADQCGAGGGGIAGVSDACQGCLIGAITGACAASYSTCTGR